MDDTTVQSVASRIEVLSDWLLVAQKLPGTEAMRESGHSALVAYQEQTSSDALLTGLKLQTYAHNDAASLLVALRAAVAKDAPVDVAESLGVYRISRTWFDVMSCDFVEQRCCLLLEIGRWERWLVEVCVGGGGCY